MKGIHIKINRKNNNPSQELDNIIRQCDEAILNPMCPKQIRTALKRYKKEVLINRSMLGDSGAVEWINTTVKLNQMMYEEYKRNR